MMTKRVLSMVLCLCMVLSCLPVMGLVAFADETAPVTVRIEAENAAYNKCAKVSDANFSGGAKLGSATYPCCSWKEFSEGGFFKNRIYVAYYVDAPEAGTYQVSVAANMKMNEACTPYAAILVNPLSGAETIAYKLPYAPVEAGVANYLVSQKVDVQLIKGRNVIYMTPFTEDQPRNWADIDYIEITGAQAVTAIAPQQVTLPANVGYYYKASNVSASGLGGGVHDPINNNGIHAENITRDFLKNITHTSITVEAPADGYYDLSYTITGAGSNGTGGFALAMFVDDATTAEVKPYVWNNCSVDVSTYLTKGTHTLTITTSMPKNQEKADAENVAWTDLKGLTLSGGLKLAEYQDSPMHAGNVLEAERDGYAWRYPSIDTNENSLQIGGVQPGATKQTYDELAGGAKLNKNQPMVTYYIDVETAGTYTVNTSFRGYTNNDSYMIVSVDDQAYYKAGINGTDPTRNNRWLATANVELTAGRHFVRLITLPGDTGAEWCNVDYTEFAGPGGVAAMNDWQHLQSGNADYIHGFTDTNYTDHASFGSQWQKALSGYQGNSMADNAGVTTGNFKNANSCGAGNVHSYSTSTYPDYFAEYLFLDPAKNLEFSLQTNNGTNRATDNGGYIANIDAHPFVDKDGTKYLFWVDSRGPDRICGVEMENWLKPKWETATALLYHNYYTVNDWKNGSSNIVNYENYTTTNEGPFVMEHNGKYYMTYSAGNWKYNTYLVAQAVSDSILGPYTKLKESEGGVMLSGSRQGGQESTGTGHHSFVTAGDQLFIVYHRHNDPTVGGGARNHAIDEVKWVTMNGREVMYVNGPSTSFQPRVEKHSTYRNIAEEATVTSSVSSANPKYLNDGLLSHYKNANSTFVNYIQETTLTGTTTFTFGFEEARTIKSIMVYNSKSEDKIFRDIEQIKLTCLENGKVVTKYINNIPFNEEYFQTDSSGTVTYVQPCSAAYAIFNELQVLSVEITVKVPAGQTYVGISEIRILGK